jgi:hypothetical protein
MAKTKSAVCARGGNWFLAARVRTASLALAVLVLSTAACTSGGESVFGPSASSSAPAPAGNGSGVSLGRGSQEGGIPVQVGCTAGTGAACVPVCSGGATTTYEGTVYDPADANPLYNVAVYIPNSPLPDPLPAGAQCGCSGFFPQTILTSAVTDENGHFVLQGVPTGKGLPLVVQAGKWRKLYQVDIDVPCQPNVAADRSLRLPRSASEGSLPDIAISTGGADSLECLLLRIGVDASEYVAGAGSGGHIHIFAGFAGATTAAGAPASNEALWDSEADLMANDVVLLSCEGQETANVTAASQEALLDYASQGGRAFASHYHYVWFDQGPFDTYRLAQWMTGPQIVVPDDNAAVPGNVVTTLANGQGFPEGAALQGWLANVGALTQGSLPIWYARDNVVLLNQPPSVPWIQLDPSVAQAPGAIQYFSLDAPIGYSLQCGRVVYSDLHVSGGPGSDEPGVPPDYPDAGLIGTNRKGGIVPSGCAAHPLTPQEEALEFMLFDLSSCLVPIGQGPSPVPIAQ